MGNLVEDLGRGYINDFFSGSYFLYEGNLHKLIGANSSGTLATYMYEEVPVCFRYEACATSIPWSALDSFKNLSWPKLGYRNMLSSDETIIAAHITATRNTRRGLAEDCLNVTYSHAASIYLSNQAYPSHTTCMVQIYYPKWYTFTEALTLLETKQAISIALNPDISLAVSVQSPDKAVIYDILFREKVVGSVLSDKQITFYNKSFSKMKMFNKLTKG